jgi:hypothetical protein
MSSISFDGTMPPKRLRRCLPQKFLALPPHVGGDVFGSFPLEYDGDFPACR